MILRLAVLALIVTLTVGCPIPAPDPEPTGPTWNAGQVDNHPSVQPVAVVVADMDGDGDLDVVSAWRGAPIGGGDELGLIAIHLQQDPANWQTIVIDEGVRYSEVNAITVADIDLDAHPDVVVAVMDRVVYQQAPDDPIQVNEWKVFEIQASIADEFLAWFDVAAGQIDGVDGLDIVAALADDGRVVWFRAPHEPDDVAWATGWVLNDIDATTRSLADSVALFDLNDDDLLDVISTAPGEAEDVISWYEHPEDLVMEEWAKHPMSDFNGATRFDIADLDGDGNVDLAAISPVDQRAAWFLQPSTVTSRWGGFVLAEFNRGFDNRLPIDIAIADIEGNDQNDVVIATSEPGGLSWFTPGTDNQTRWTETVIISFTNANTGLIDVGDIDADLDPDVVTPYDDTERDSRDSIRWYQNPYNPIPATQPAP